MAIIRHAATRIFLGLGSNLGDRLLYLQQGISALERSDVRLVRSSSVYESEAHRLEPDPQPAYLNAVIEVDTKHRPEALLQIIMQAEIAAGRAREAGIKWQPRTLDIDILLYGERVVQSPDLAIPHPRLAERRFVLEPLVEIAPRFVIPMNRAVSAAELLERCADSTAIRRIHPPSILFQPTHDGTP